MHLSTQYPAAARPISTRVVRATKALLGVAAVVALFIVAALFMTARIHSPAVHPSSANAQFARRESPPASVRAFLVRSCSDCHSSESAYPWYHQIPFVGGIIERDIQGAQRSFDLATWPPPAASEPVFRAALLVNLCEQVRLKDMPPTRYLALHPAATPTVQEVDDLCRWSEVRARQRPHHRTNSFLHSLS